MIKKVLGRHTGTCFTCHLVEEIDEIEFDDGSVKTLCSECIDDVLDEEENAFPDFATPEEAVAAANKEATRFGKSLEAILRSPDVVQYLMESVILRKALRFAEKRP